MDTKRLQVHRIHRELLASWMTKNGYATGHGDNLADLLDELDWQHKERLDKLKWQVRDTCKRAEKAEAEVERLRAVAEAARKVITEMQGYIFHAGGRGSIINLEKALAQLEESK